MSKSPSTQRLEACVVHPDGTHSRIIVRELVRVNYEQTEGTETVTVDDIGTTRPVKICRVLDYVFEDLSGQHISYPRIEWMRPAPQGRRSK